MRMAKAWGALGAALLALATPAAVLAQDAAPAAPSSLVLAQEIVDAGFPANQRMAMFSASTRELMAQVRQSLGPETRKPAVEDVLDAYEARTMALTEQMLTRHLDALMQGIVVAYAETLNREQLEGLHSFVTSPAGRGFLAQSTLMMSHPAFAEANTAYMTDYLAELPRLQQQLREDLTRAMSEAQ